MHLYLYIILAVSIILALVLIGFSFQFMLNLLFYTQCKIKDCHNIIQAHGLMIDWALIVEYWPSQGLAVNTNTHILLLNGNSCIILTSPISALLFTISGVYFCWSNNCLTSCILYKFIILDDIIWIHSSFQLMLWLFKVIGK